MKTLRLIRDLLPVHLVLAVTMLAHGETPGHLMMIGGNLRPDDAAIFHRMIEYAGGAKEARFVVLRTASATVGSALNFRQQLAAYGVPLDRIQILDVTPGNAGQAAFNPTLIQQVHQSTGLFMTGGDQQWITRALFQKDGADTPLLKEIRSLLARGGVIAGSSAGAAVQCDPMISVSGLADDALDDGFDALDFGITTRASRPGLLVTRGLGFFRFGVVDQHFFQMRGRLARLARATAESRDSLGFGIDEGTALVASTGNEVEVLGAGYVTVIVSADATCTDGPRGCHINNVRLSVLATGDRFDARKKTVSVADGKREIVRGKETNYGNFLIPDMNAEGSTRFAILDGLADNTQRKQEGIALKHYDSYAHGYRFTLQKDASTRTFGGYVNGFYSYTVLKVLLDIEPITGALRPSTAFAPADLESCTHPEAVLSVSFRGILPVDDEKRFRPVDVITRQELAQALSRSVHLVPPKTEVGPVLDVPASAQPAEDVQKVLTAGLMRLDKNGNFRPNEPVTRVEAASAFVRLAERLHRDEISAPDIKLVDLDGLNDADRRAAAIAVGAAWLAARQDRFHPMLAVSREETAIAIRRIIGLP